jgi:rhodanese-related sulfurtransferase
MSSVVHKNLVRPGTLAMASLLVVTALTAQGCAMLKRRAEERPPYRKVSPPIAYEMLRDTPSMLILDLRSAPSFHGDTGHIYRAYNIPSDRLPFRLLEISSFREETFLVYCDTPECAEQGMSVLVSSGFESAVLIEGGIESWIAKGFRTVLPAELAGQTQQAAGTSSKTKREERLEREDREEETAAAVSAAQPAALTTTPLPVICTEPHVQVQKPPY